MHVALEFNHGDEAAAVAIADILRAAGLTKGWFGRYERMVWSSRELVLLPDGTVVASCPNVDEPVVANALAGLANKMKWKVER